MAKYSPFALALVFLLAPLGEASTIQLYTSVSDTGVDADLDSFNGGTFVVSPTPSAPSGFPFDLDDNTTQIFPGNPEVLDGLDNDQDGVIDGSVGVTSINALPDLILNEGDSFTADWIVNGIDSLPLVFLQAFPDGATYTESLTDTLEITATVGWTAQPGDAGQSYLFRVDGPDDDEFTVSVVPEPSTLVLGLVGCIALGAIGWSRRGAVRSWFRRRHRH